MLVALCIPSPFSSPCDDMLTMLVCATCWLSMHSLAYVFMHESCLPVCCPHFNTMKLWTFDPNLHLSLKNTTFCLPFCLFVFFLFACFPVCLLAFLSSCLSYGSSCLLPYTMHVMSIILICFMPLSYALCIFPFHYLSAGFLSLPLHVHTWSENAWS